MNIEYISTKQAAKQWQISIKSVQTYCKDGLIPLAYKEQGKWRIPENAYKPLTKSQISQFLIILLRMQEGYYVDYEVLGIDESACKKVYSYLSTLGFIVGFSNSADICEAISTVKLTQEGVEYIKQSNHSNFESSSIAEIINLWGPTIISLSAALIPLFTR